MIHFRINGHIKKAGKDQDIGCQLKHYEAAHYSQKKSTMFEDLLHACPFH